jgi:hypothetical protein
MAGTIAAIFRPATITALGIQSAHWFVINLIFAPAAKASYRIVISPYRRQYFQAVVVDDA